MVLTGRRDRPRTQYWFRILPWLSPYTCRLHSVHGRGQRWQFGPDNNRISVHNHLFCMDLKVGEISYSFRATARPVSTARWQHPQGQEPHQGQAVLPCASHRQIEESLYSQCVQRDHRQDHGYARIGNNPCSHQQGWGYILQVGGGYPEVEGQQQRETRQQGLRIPDGEGSQAVRPRGQSACRRASHRVE